MISTARRDRWIGWGLFGLAFLGLWATQAAVGYPRDESVYFAAAESYASWFRLLWQSPLRAFTDAAIVQAFDVNHEHPVLMKSLFGLSYLLFHQGLEWLRPATAFRLPAFAINALIPALLYWLGAGVFSRRAGLFAALGFFLVPRQYFNAQLACFDMPVAAFWLLTVYAFWRAQQGGRAWLWTGAAFGLAIATKHNALFLPFVLAPFALGKAIAVTRGSPEAQRVLWRLLGAAAAVLALFGVLAISLGPTWLERLSPLSPHLALAAVWVGTSAVLLSQLSRLNPDAFRALAPLAAMALLGPVIFYLHWPYLWHEPVGRTSWYLAFHAQHNHYTWFYLGKLLREPPFPLDYVLVKTALTVPVTLFFPMALGWLGGLAKAVLWLPRRTRSWLGTPSFGELLVLVNGAVSIAIISHPDVPHFGGVKHWFPSMPFLALGAGVVVDRAADTARELLGRHWPRMRVSNEALTAGLFSALLIAPLWATARVHPYGTAYYSELAGGLPGAATLGMQRQFWSSHVTFVFPWLNEHAPRGTRLYLHEVNGYSFRDYQRNGQLRSDFVPAGGPADAEVAVYQYHQEFREHEFEIWQSFGTTRPVTGLYLDETPQIVVYQRR